MSRSVRFSCLMLGLVSSVVLAQSDTTGSSVTESVSTDELAQDLSLIAPIATIHIGVNNPWQFFLRGRTSNGEPPTLIGVTLPPTAVMAQAADGWSQISWRPGMGDIGRHLITVRAVDLDVPDRYFDRDIVVEVQPLADERVVASRDVGHLAPAAANPVIQLNPSVTDVNTSVDNAPGSAVTTAVANATTTVAVRTVNRSSYIGEGDSSVASQATTNSGLDNASNHSPNVATNALIERGKDRKPPTLRPIATHIINAGRTLSVRIAPEYESEFPPIIHIDRLPPNASFDVNQDGTRTFYWPTSDSDQGQHRFRLNVIHPEDASLSTSQAMTIIVGDPTRQSTVPADR